MNVPRIDPEFSSLIPPLAPEELALLESNIVADGCRDPLVIWNGLLLDGHNRLAICTRLGIEFQTQEVKLADHDAGKVWVIRNQFGRRNITLTSRCELAEKLAEALRPKAKENQKARKGKQPGADKSVNIDGLVDVREQAAKEAGVSVGSMVPRDSFESQVESEHPPTITALAEPSPEAPSGRQSDRVRAAAWIAPSRGGSCQGASVG
jgi:hypothetical protein